MQPILTVFIPIAVGITFLVLVVGVVSMLRGGKFDAKHSNRLMRLRVIAQLVAVLLMGAFFLLAKR